MGLIKEKIKVKWNGATRKHYEELGYSFTKYGDEFEIWNYELTKGSGHPVKGRCDSCGRKIHYSMFKDYNRRIKEDGNIYCAKCAMELYGSDNIRKTLLKKSISFAEYVTNEMGEFALFLLWDYDRNKDINPQEISYKSGKTIWLKCQEKDYHGSYETTPRNFSEGRRCPYCAGKEVHPKDSIGQYIIDNYGEEFLHKVWSDKNDKTPFEYTYRSCKKVWWKCQDNEHDDYYRDCDSSVRYNFRCPECYNVKGENNPNWNPNLTDEERKKRRNIEGYNDFIKEVYKRDNWTCQCCNEKGKKINAHHLNSYDWDKEHRIDINNGITLCEDCHKEFHHIYGYGNNTKEQYEEWIKIK